MRNCGHRAAAPVRKCPGRHRLGESEHPRTPEQPTSGGVCTLLQVRQAGGNFSILRVGWPIRFCWKNASMAPGGAVGSRRTASAAGRFGLAARGTGMVKQALVLGTVAALALAASGCGVFHAMYYEPYGPGLGPDMAHCPHRVGACMPAEAYSPSCAPGICAEHPSARYAACQECGQPWAPDDCGPYTDGHCGPLTLVFALFRHHCFWGAGCSGRYYGEWLSDPPDCCDPCDFTARGVSFEGVGVPGESVPCQECQGAAALRQPGQSVARVSVARDTSGPARRGRPPARIADSASRPSYPPRPGQGYPPRGGYAQRQALQVASPKTPPASYTY